MAVQQNSLPVGRPRTMISVRVDKQLKDQIDAQAKAAGMTTSQYLYQHFEELTKQYPGRVVAEEEVKIPNPDLTTPPGYPPQQQPYGYPPQQPPYGYPPQPYPYYPPPAPYALQPTGPDQMDLMFADMRKMFLTKMMAEMVQGKKSIEDVYAAQQQFQQGGKKEDFSMNDMMKWQFQMNMMERQQQKDMQNAQLALETARSKGDAKGEKNALELIVGLSTAAAQQNQNFMSQFMAAQQMAQNTQTTLFTTALSSNKAAEDSARQDRNMLQGQISQVQTNMMQNQLQSVQSMGNMQIEYLKADLERMRANPPKDPLTQLIELDALSKNSPVMGAAIKAAFGGGGGISDLIPLLKDSGFAPVIDKLTGFLGGVISGMTGRGQGQSQMPPVPQLAATPTPAELPQPPLAPGIPPPMQPPTAEQLSKLHLTPQPQPQPQPQLEQPPAPVAIDGGGPLIAVPAYIPETKTPPGQMIAYTTEDAKTQEKPDALMTEVLIPANPGEKQKQPTMNI